MPHVEENPLVFFRVQDDGSQTQYCKHSGILSRNQSRASFDPRVPETLESIQDHPDWASREPSAYISVYSDETTAFGEARRRLTIEHEDVVWRSTLDKGTRWFSTETSDAWLIDTVSGCLRKLGTTVNTNGYSYTESLTV
ncbi:hypothetical protein D6D18_09278 [Aureobasidium pullulans]|nr:hypothetical protein D6D18_09278 [Aureobasidium pullulans]